MKKLSLLLVLALYGCGGAWAQSANGFSSMLQRGSIPKWATAVCFVERFADEQSQMRETVFDWDSTDDGTDFLVYGPKGAFRIRSVSFANGELTGETIFSRNRDDSDGSSFTAIYIPHRREGYTVKLRLLWGPPSAFYEEIDSLSSGQPIMKSSGRCHAIKAR